MAATVNPGNLIPGGGALVVSGSAKAVWQPACDDIGANGTQHGTAALFNPIGVTSSAFRWIRVPDGATRVLLQARLPRAVTAVATNPTVGVIGCYRFGPNTGAGNSLFDPVTAAAAEVRFLRLDAATIGASGTTIAWDATPATTDTLYDATYWYSPWPTATGYDLLGCEWVGCVTVVKSGALTGGSTPAMPLDVMFIN